MTKITHNYKYRLICTNKLLANYLTKQFYHQNSGGTYKIESFDKTQSNAIN
jgi:hypothetical protein